MYQIDYVLAEKFYGNGAIARQKSTGKMFLNTPAGVNNFINEMKPFYTISIMDAVTRKDVTAEFVKN